MALPHHIKAGLEKEPSHHRRFVINSTADRTLRGRDSGATLTNYGATGTVTYSLPTAPEKGTYFIVAVAAAFELRLDPASGHNFIASGAAQTAGKYASMDDEGEGYVVTYIGSNVWLISQVVGTLTIEG